MAGKILTDDNKKILKMIYDFGGYVRIAHLDCMWPDLVHRSKQKKLEKLVDMGYLTARRFRTNSKMEPVTYQVTKPTCAMFYNPDCYFRKKHIVEYAHRALIKSYFCFENYKSLGECFITDNMQKIIFFRNARFNEALFPVKTNKGVSFVHFEELVIDFTKNNGFVLENNGKLLYKDIGQRLIIAFIDKYHVPVKKQIASLVNRYIDLIHSGGDYGIDFIIVVDSEGREELYKSDVESFINKNIKVNRISNELIKIYWEVLYKTEDDITRRDLTDIKNNDYKKLKEQILNIIPNIDSELTDEQKAIISQVKIKGETFIKDTLKSYYSNSIESFKRFYKKFFDNLFFLEYHNYISLSQNALKPYFDIKVYRIGCSIYD